MFNARLKRRMDEVGIAMPVPQMQVHMSSRGEHVVADEDDSVPPAHEATQAGVTRDASHEPRPAPPPTAGPDGAPPQIPTAGGAGTRS